MAEKLETKSKLYPTYYAYPIPFNPEEGMDVFSPTDVAPEVEDVDKEFKTINCYNNNISIMKSGIEFPYTEAQLAELKKCKNDILYFIVNYCKIVTLKHGVQKFKLFQYQKNAIKVMHENRFSIFKFPRQMGKALWEETPILTTNGFKLLKDINIGDYVFDDSGTAVCVINKTEQQLDRDCYKITLDSAQTSSMIFFIIANAMIFAHFLTDEQIPQQITQMIIDANVSPLMFLLIVNILLLIMGQFMEPSSVVMITVPLLLPIGMALGIDPIHLGVIMVVNMEIGMLTPPVGLNLFVASGITGLSMGQVIKASIPMTLVLLFGLVLITYIPAISLWLPNLMFGY
jgi:hypothetical protein